MNDSLPPFRVCQDQTWYETRGGINFSVSGLVIVADGFGTVEEALEWCDKSKKTGLYIYGENE